MYAKLLERCENLFEVKEGKLIRKCMVAPNALKGSEAGWLDTCYRKVRVDKITHLTHRIIYLLEYKTLPEIIDHKDGDTQNNLPSNLRSASKMENRWNCVGNHGSISGYKGVYQDGSKWKGLITRNGTRHYLGMFSTPELAFEAVQTKSKELSGKFHKQET